MAGATLKILGHSAMGDLVILAGLLLEGYAVFLYLQNNDPRK